MLIVGMHTQQIPAPNCNFQIFFIHHIHIHAPMSTSCPAVQIHNHSSSSLNLSKILRKPRFYPPLVCHHIVVGARVFSVPEAMHTAGPMLLSGLCTRW